MLELPRLVVPGYFRASEAGARMAMEQDATIFATFVCIRRRAPRWYSALAPSERYARHHFPIPPSSDPGCGSRVRQLVSEFMPSLPQPVLIFCKEGRHRAGMVAAALVILGGGSLAAALTEYEAGACPGRERERAIIRSILE